MASVLCTPSARTPRYDPLTQGERTVPCLIKEIGDGASTLPELHMSIRIREITLLICLYLAPWGFKTECIDSP